MSETADVIIIGAGVIGAATAFELARRGHRTLSVDRNAEVGARQHVRFLRHHPRALFHARRHRLRL